MNSHSHWLSFVHSVAERPGNSATAAPNAIKNEKQYAMYADEKAIRPNCAPTNGNGIIQLYVLFY